MINPLVNGFIWFRSYLGLIPHFMRNFYIVVLAFGLLAILIRLLRR